ncbi:hypothetical protein [Klebsiella aerogenes]|uniref:hypothetical protein n=1 Tax=Klebsiella aerogenes TaxID=548 RepID=UPI003D316DA8
MNSEKFIRNLGVVKDKTSELYHFHVFNDLKNNKSTLFGRKKSSAEETNLYSTTHNFIRDINKVDDSYASKNFLSSFVWCERKGISSHTELHYAEIDEKLNVVRHTILDNGSAINEYVLVRASLVEDMLLLTWVDELEQMVKLRLYALDTLLPVSADLKVESPLNRNYFNTSQNRTANLTLTPARENKFYLQFLLDSGSICCYEIIVSDNTLHSEHLFEQGGENVGYHEALFDADYNKLMTVYSENNLESLNNINDVYIINQSIFSEHNFKGMLSLPTRVNQTTGFYLRPTFLKYKNQFIVLWEGTSLHYTGLNSDLNITIPEEIIDIANPAYIHMLDNGSLLVSVQKDNWRTIDYGESLFSAELPI